MLVSVGKHFIRKTTRTINYMSQWDKIGQIGLFDSKLLFLNHSGFFVFFSSEKNRIKQSAIMYNFLFFFFIVEWVITFTSILH